MNEIIRNYNLLTELEKMEQVYLWFAAVDDPFVDVMPEGAWDAANEIVPRRDLDMTQPQVKKFHDAALYLNDEINYFEEAEFFCDMCNTEMVANRDGECYGCGYEATDMTPEWYELVWYRGGGEKRPHGFFINKSKGE